MMSYPNIVNSKHRKKLKMIIKKINGAYLPRQDRILLKIAIEKNEEKNHYQLLLTRRLVKALMQSFKKIVQEKSSVTEAKKTAGSKPQKIPQDAFREFGPHLVMNFMLKKNHQQNLSFILSLIFDNKKLFNITCSKQIIRSLFDLFFKLQEKAEWNLEDILKPKKIVKSKSRPPIKRTLH